MHTVALQVEDACVTWYSLSVRVSKVVTIWNSLSGHHHVCSALCIRGHIAQSFDRPNHISILLMFRILPANSLLRLKGVRISRHCKWKHCDWLFLHLNAVLKLIFTDIPVLHICTVGPVRNIYRKWSVYVRNPVVHANIHQEETLSLTVKSPFPTHLISQSDKKHFSI